MCGLIPVGLFYGFGALFEEIALVFSDEEGALRFENQHGLFVAVIVLVVSASPMSLLHVIVQEKQWASEFQIHALGLVLLVAGLLVGAASLYWKLLWLWYVGCASMCGLGELFIFRRLVFNHQLWFKRIGAASIGAGLFGFGIGAWTVFFFLISVPLLQRFHVSTVMAIYAGTLVIMLYPILTINDKDHHVESSTNNNNNRNNNNNNNNASNSNSNSNSKSDENNTHPRTSSASNLKQQQQQQQQQQGELIESSSTSLFPDIEIAAADDDDADDDDKKTTRGANEKVTQGPNNDSHFAYTYTAVASSATTGTSEARFEAAAANEDEGGESSRTAGGDQSSPPSSSNSTPKRQSSASASKGKHKGRGYRAKSLEYGLGPGLEEEGVGGGELVLTTTGRGQKRHTMEALEAVVRVEMPVMDEKEGWMNAAEGTSKFEHVEQEEREEEEGEGEEEEDEEAFEFELTFQELCCCKEAWMLLFFFAAILTPGWGIKLASYYMLTGLFYLYIYIY